MTYIIAGLGNPGDEYKETRHNTGRIMVEALAKHLEIDPSEFSFDKKLNATCAETKIGKEKALLVMPETFMNNSGKAIGPLVTTKSAGATKTNLKKAGQLVVIYDDFNLPLGRIKISFNRSSGGHNGVESIIKAAKTEAFLRIRVGVAPATAKGTAKVPSGDAVIEKFILTPFKPTELAEIKKVSKRVVEAVEAIVKEGKDVAMSTFNAN